MINYYSNVNSPVDDTGKFDSNVSGFYYNQQLGSALLSVGLYPNTKIGTDGWIAFSGTEAEDTSVNSTKFPYSKKPIAVSVLNEDFQVSIANEWTEFGGDPISAMWNENRGLAPYMAEIGKDVGAMVQQTIDRKNSGSDDQHASFLDTIASIGSFISENAEKQSEYLSRALVVQGTMFSYYGGTGIDFGNLGMRYTIFPDFEGENFVTVPEQLQDLLPYVIGDFVSVTELGDNAVGNFAKKFTSWQLPPAGFRADIQNIDVIQQGTFKLRLGAYYSLDNLVISGCRLNFSKTMVKDPTVNASKDGQNLTPLYCEVELQLKPASKYSKNRLLQFINAKSNGTKERLSAIKKDTKSKLSVQKSVNESMISGDGNSISSVLGEVSKLGGGVFKNLFGI